MLRLRRFFAFPLLFVLCASLLSCKTSDDARALATQMTSTASCLSDYYAALAQIVDNHARLERLQQATSGVPLDAQDQAQLSDVQADLQKRSEMAKALADLAKAFTGLSGSKAPADVSTSAADLGTALAAIPNMPGGSDAATVLQNAGKILTQFAQERDERKMAKSIDPTIAALSQMYTQEKPVYDSIDRTYIGLAQGIALDLVNHNQVDPNSLMAPALQPFDLSSRVPTEQLSQGLADYAREQIKTKAATDIAAHSKASDTMDGALKELAKRTHELAAEGRMPQRGFPSLADVESWIEPHQKQHGK